MAAIAQKWTEEIKESFHESIAWECKYQSWIDYNIHLWFVKLQTWDYEPTESQRGKALKGLLSYFKKQKENCQWLKIWRKLFLMLYIKKISNESEDFIQANAN